MADKFEIFISLRYDPLLYQCFNNPDFSNVSTNYAENSPYYILSYHVDRILKATKHFKWNIVHDALLEDPHKLAVLKVLDQTASNSTEPLGLRLTVGPSGITGCTARPAIPSPLNFLFPKTFSVDFSKVPESVPIFEVFVYKKVTEVTEFTHFKTTHRQPYDKARKAYDIKRNQEVLLVNKFGEITEGSITTPYFYRDEEWITPAVDTALVCENNKQNVRGAGGQAGTTRRWAIETGLAVEKNIQANSVVNDETIWLSNGIRGFFLGKISVN